jgi:hypothetical protein
MNALKRSSLFWTLAAILCCLLVANCDQIPRKSSTFKTMLILEGLICDYHQVNNVNPRGLQDLAEVRAGREKAIDAWGAPIKYSVAPDSSVILSSHDPTRNCTIFLHFDPRTRNRIDASF